MNVKAEAYQEYNQAAVIDKLFTSMPEIVRALASSAGQRGQDHHRLHRQRRCVRHEQDHRRHHQDGGAGAGAVRDAVRHADVGAAGQGPPDRRQDAEADALPPNGASREVAETTRWRTGVLARPRPCAAKLSMERDDMKQTIMQIGLGIALGAGIGAAIGVAAGHMAVWLAVGIAIGVAIGSNFRAGTELRQSAQIVHAKTPG